MKFLGFLLLSSCFCYSCCVQHDIVTSTGSDETDSSGFYNKVKNICRNSFDYFYSSEYLLFGNLCNKSLEKIYLINDEINPNLGELLKTFYFRYVKIDLSKPCLFWKDDPLCVGDDCESLVDAKMKNVSLGNIQFQREEQESNLLESLNENTVDFVLLEKEASNKGLYVNLLDNPERFTGYSGRPALKIWESIYAECCFKYNGTDPKIKGEKCLEHEVFYRVISGFHASVSLHLAYKSLDTNLLRFAPNLTIYKEKVGNHPQRLKNTYFLYMVLLRAVKKAGYYLSNHEYNTGNSAEDANTTNIISKVTNITVDTPDLFDEEVLFKGDASDSLKSEFQVHFRNISQIMDCVECQRCRLWGKIQTMGIGTALKVLFSFKEADRDQDFRLTRTEIITLMNTMGKLSDSVYYIRDFEGMIARIKENDDYNRFMSLLIIFIVIAVILTILVMMRRKFSKGIANDNPEKVDGSH